MWLFCQYIAQFVCLYHHSWNVEWAFEDIAFCGLCHSAVAMQIAVPLATLIIGEVRVCPLAYLLVPDKIFVIARCFVCVEGCEKVEDTTAAVMNALSKFEA